MRVSKKQKIAIAKIIHASWSLSCHLSRCSSVLAGSVLWATKLILVTAFPRGGKEYVAQALLSG